jgi:hypothetical protein
MIYIAHRGNIDGPNPEEENNPKYLLKAIEKGFYIETDLWMDENEKLFLGHDFPQYEIEINFLLEINDKLFCHCKNIKAFYFIIKNYPEIECFFHDKDECVLTSKKHIWNYPGTELTPISICVNLDGFSVEREGKLDKYDNYLMNKNIYGICSDFLTIHIVND